VQAVSALRLWLRQERAREHQERVAHGRCLDCGVYEPPGYWVWGLCGLCKLNAIERQLERDRERDAFYVATVRFVRRPW
jgi:hypothetical protein